MGYVTVGRENSNDITLYYKDWGTGQPIVFSHGWPLSSDAWEDQMLFLAAKGYRCIAHDRRGHGRSTHNFEGNDMDTYADDLARLVQALKLENVIHVGHSTGGGEVVRYIARHGDTRVAKAVLISAVPPLMLKTTTNPNGISIDVFDDIRQNVLSDRSQFFQELPAAFYGTSKGDNVSQGLKDTFWVQGVQGGLKSIFDCIKAFSETDFTQDLQKINVPVLLIHGDEDQIVPIGNSSLLSKKLLKNSELKIYKGGSHGICSTHKDQINTDLLEFFNSKFGS
ncbi:chloroperoxidase [Legionella lansingensis]|uniref:Chloroperoxidase n=1 Tax=Legionella lansingensis TaxID=45067 RepID=A0A0W0VHL0_9GAMM|nr:alpha/beta hydrolase [Legionella lansingensis]KTD19612.1 chloroperoxidase [Legionella lansingensis]SNV50231.1 chloroperoxidase [Legionella lansingensis]